MKFLQEFKSAFSISGIVTFFVGLLLLIYPGFTNRALCYTLSAVLIVKGVSGLIARYRQNGYPPMPYEIIRNIAIIALGAFVALRSDVIISIIPFFFGLFLLVSGISSLQKASILKQMGYAGRKNGTLMAALKLILAALIILNPFSTAIALTRFIGICLVYDGASSLATVFRLAKAKIAADKAEEELRDLNLRKEKTTGDIPVVDAEFVDVVQNTIDAEDQ